MGHSSKFIFPLPGRKSKAAPAPTVPGPLTTKAQKILGTAEITLDTRPIPGWEGQSTAGISIAVTETTGGTGRHGASSEGWAAPKTLQDRGWEQESEIIPAVLNRQPELLGGSLGPDGVTDASSLRRRQSSSTITSYYDKSKQPLSISQQTSNSAMAKGLPPKAMALLDMDNEITEATAQAKRAKKKPSRLDLSALLGRSKSPKHLQPDANTRDASNLALSPVSMPTSPLPPPVQQRPERRSLRKMVTREPMREPPAQPQVPTVYEPAQEVTDAGVPQQTKTSLDLYNLYDHYERRTFVDEKMEEPPRCAFAVEPPLPSPPPNYPLPTPPGPPPGKSLLAPFPGTAVRSGPGPKPSPLMNADRRPSGAGMSANAVPADCASVSSRHTRTSKASRRTDRSMQEIDLLQNSVLALSSDSDDDYELSSRDSLAVPTSNDGQASPTSPQSPGYPPRSGLYDGGARGNPVKRNGHGAGGQLGFHDSSVGVGPNGLRIAPRTSSLHAKSAPAPGIARAKATLDSSRLSINTTSTDCTVSGPRTVGPSPGPGPAIKGPKKMRSESLLDFPAPPSIRTSASRSAPGSRLSEQSFPSPTSADFYSNGQRYAAGDNGSIRSGTSMGSAPNGGRRGSATNSLHDGGSGRFMAVTKQEELLLAALRMKRARMIHEDIIAEFEGDMEPEDHHELRRVLTNDSFGTSGSMTRHSSTSTMRQPKGTLSARPPEIPRFPPPSQLPSKPKPKPKSRSEKSGKADLLRVVIDRSPFDPSIRTPGSDISDFIHHHDDSSSITTTMSGNLERNDSRASSTSSPRSVPARQPQRGATGGTTPMPSSRLSQRSKAETNPLRLTTGQFSPAVSGPSSPLSLSHKDLLPLRILEDPEEDEDDDDELERVLDLEGDFGVPRPDSPISPCDFPTPGSGRATKQTKQQVRLSAVGLYKPPTESGW
ncbi:hypothetical protein B0J18DRAFT_276092 [Chaetomium sp. MPI-SDFR-AT-0129]|nr:hypothetical protein B0J18DRAFT_276092 [Chaetomium sp. MPI-SDFR-AT-0129]